MYKNLYFLRFKYFRSAFIRGILPGLAYMLSSCETITEIDLPEEPSQLVVNSILNADSALTVNLSKSHSVNINYPVFDHVENAVVEVYKNKVQLTKLNYVGKGNYRSPSPLAGEPYSEYSLKINAPGFKTSEASDILPGKPVIVSSRFDLEPQSNNIDRRYKATLILDDHSENNFYELRIFDHTDRSELAYDLDNKLNQFNLANTSLRMVQLFDDKSFNGKKVTLDISFSFYNINNKARKISIILKNISRPYYDYQYSAARYFKSDPVLSPVQPVKNNIINASGIFGTYNAVVIPAQL